MTGRPTSNVAIIGGGMAGLAAGIRLARGGVPVTVFERSAGSGGRARSTHEHGFDINLGPHALYPGAEAALAELGIHVEGGRPGTKGIALSSGRRHILPAGPGSILRSGYLGPRQKVRAGLAFKAVLETKPESLRGRTLADWIGEIGGDGKVRALLESYFRLGTYANAPHLLDAEIALRHFQDGAKGVLYADGGWGRIADAMRRRLEQEGGTLRAGARIEALAPGDGCWGLRLASGETFAAAGVIIATPPKDAAKLLEGCGPPAIAQELRSLIPATVATLDAGVARLPRPGATLALGMDRPLYFQVHSAYAKLAGPGTHLLSAAMYLPVDEAVDPGAVREELEAMMDGLQPGWRDLRLTDRFLPSLAASCAIPVAGRTLPAVDGAGLPGVYLAGDWVRSNTMLAESSLRSAHEASQLAARQVRGHATLAAAI